MSALCAIPGCRVRGRHLTACEDDEKCGGCLPRLADDGYSCPVCASVAAQNLETVAEVALAVSDAANRLSSGSGGGGSGKPGSRLPFDLGARSRLDAVEGSVYGWARHIAEERGVRLPEQPGPFVPPIGPLCRTRYECTHDSCKAMRDPQQPAPMLAAVAQWLAGHLDWLAHRPEVGEAFADFAASARALRGVVRGPAEQRYLGPCGATRCALCGIVEEGHVCEGDIPVWTCNGNVYGRAGGDKGTCRTCGAQVDQGERLIWLDDVRRDWLYFVSEIADAYPIKAMTIRAWLSRGLLVAHGDRDGRPLLKLGEVLDLAAGDAARREEARATRARRSAARAAESETAA